MAWALRQYADSTLLDAVNGFFSRIKADGTLDQLIERFYGHSDVLDYVGARAFAVHMQIACHALKPFCARPATRTGWTGAC
ncbi:hypothetical protein ULG90_23235 [Halopseudomonas pachastrellae]|nr:hypothetical protein ULG90_23235 [Halopseudomonas pachastrellae]